MRRDPADVLRECAELVPGTAAEARLRGLADVYASGLTRFSLCDALTESSELPRYCDDGRAALSLAAEEIAR